MKKILAVICVLALVFAMMPTVMAAGTVTLSIGSETLETGSGSQSVTIPISISGNTNGVCGICVKLSYDSKLKLTSLKQGEALRSLVYTAPDDLSKNPVVLLWDGIEAEAGDGIILYATFTVPTENAATYRFDIDAPLGSVYDNDLEDYTVKVNRGTIEVRGEAGSTPAENTGSNDDSSAQSGETSGNSDPSASDTPDDENGGNKNWGKDNPVDGAPATPSFPGFYYIVITMTDAGAAEECRVEYYPTGNAADTPSEQQIDLSNITNATIKILDSAKEGAADPKALCYVVTDEQGHVNIKATNQLNGVE